MESFFEGNELNSEEADEIILDDISRRVFCGDIDDKYHSSETGLTSLEYLLLRNFGADTDEEIYDLKSKIHGKLLDLSGGSDLSNFECDNPKGIFLNRLKIPFRS